MKIKINYIVIPLLIITVGSLGALITGYGMEWYATIQLPPYTPSSTFISWMWRIIYLMITTSILIIFNKLNRDWRFYSVINLFITNGLLNILWSYLFFNQHMIGASTLVALLLVITVYLLIWLIWPQSRTAALLLVLYAGWITFASYLNYVILLLN